MSPTQASLDEKWIKQLEDAGFIRNGRVQFRASEVAQLLNESIFESKLDYLDRRLRGEEVPVNEYMRAGMDFEDHIVNLTIQKGGLTLEEKNVEFRTLTLGEVLGYPVVVSCKPDALASRFFMADNSNIVHEKYIIEVKYMPKHSSVKFSNDVPPWYQYQVLLYMMGFERHGIFAAATADGLYMVYKRYEEQLPIMLRTKERLLKVAEELLTKNITQDENSNPDIKQRMYTAISQPKNEVEELIVQLYQIQRENEAIISEYNKVSKKIEDIKKKIKDKLGEGSYTFLYNDTEFIIEERTSFRVDKDKLIQSIGEEEYNKYVEQSTYKIFTIKDKRSRWF